MSEKGGEELTKRAETCGKRVIFLETEHACPKPLEFKRVRKYFEAGAATGERLLEKLDRGLRA